MSESWLASKIDGDVLLEIKKKYHGSLEECSVSLVLTDSKPFTKNRFNWGTVKRFSEFNKLFMETPFDFCVSICADAWVSLLTPKQKEAIIDLQLTRIEPEYEPEVVVVNNRKQTIKDEWGRIKYTQTFKRDESGKVKWQTFPLDLPVFASNVRRYGLWFEDIADLSGLFGQESK